MKKQVAINSLKVNRGCVNMNCQYCTEHNNCPLETLIKDYSSIKEELRQKVEFIQEQRELIDSQKAELSMYKQCQGKKSSKREEGLIKENKKLKSLCNLLYDDLSYIGVFRCEKCGHYTMQG